MKIRKQLPYTNQFVLAALFFALAFAACGVGEPNAKYYFNVSPYDIRGEVYVSEVHWAGSINNAADPESDDPLDCFIEIYNNAPVPYDLSGWCIRFSGAVNRLIIIPRGPESVIGSGKYYTIGRRVTDETGMGAFSELDLVLPDFAIPTAPFMIVIQDPGGRTSDTVDFLQKPYLPSGAALPFVRRSAVRTENFFGGDDGASYESWAEYRKHDDTRAYENINPKYRGRVFCSPGSR